MLTCVSMVIGISHLQLKPTTPENPIIVTPTQPQKAAPTGSKGLSSDKIPTLICVCWSARVLFRNKVVKNTRKTKVDFFWTIIVKKKQSGVN